ncbi:MAG: 5-formyltetrahydrofolate cyclo-ligase [Bacilli bacterium]|nr:5-formyltetrahydrofolate cyclo-ligase [Bacilli bacterium]
MKDDIRKEYLIKRSNIKDRNNKDNNIYNKIINLKIYKESKVIALYNSMSTEVDTKKLIEYSLNKQKIVLLPKVINNKMIFVRINNNTKYIKSNFGVEEPINVKAYNSKIDLMLVPLVVFDETCNRIGYGKGYYDRYLNNKNINTIGIAYEEQKYSIIPQEEHDIKLDQIITDKKVYYKK